MGTCVSPYLPVIDKGCPGGGSGEGGHHREIGLSGAQVKRAVAEKVWLAVGSTPRVSAHCWPGLRGSPNAAAL